MWHVTYRDHDGNVQVKRIRAENRNRALSYTAQRYDVPRASVLSAVKISN